MSGNTHSELTSLLIVSSVCRVIISVLMLATMQLSHTFLNITIHDSSHITTKRIVNFHRLLSSVATAMVSLSLSVLTAIFQVNLC